MTYDTYEQVTISVPWSVRGDNPLDVAERRATPARGLGLDAARLGRPIGQARREAM